jgi:phosphate transport system substrate-binding protein
LLVVVGEEFVPETRQIKGEGFQAQDHANDDLKLAIAPRAVHESPQCVSNFFSLPVVSLSADFPLALQRLNDHDAVVAPNPSESMNTLSWNDRKSRPWVALSALLAGLLAPGCSENQSPPGAPAQSLSGKIIIRGSNTVGEELAPRLISEYRKDHSGAAFDLECKATRYGLAALMAGQCDIAAASRTPVKEEIEMAQNRGVELNDHMIGWYSVAVVANAALKLDSLSKDQIRDIFTGVTTNWKQVGGPDASISVYGRDPISGTYLGFRELAMENKPYGPGLKTFTNYDAVIQAVAQDSAGIGYSSLQQAQQSSGVTMISIDGAVPKPTLVASGKYPYCREMRLYTSKGHERAEAVDFVKYIMSPKGQAVLDEMGFTPLGK